MKWCLLLYQLFVISSCSVAQKSFESEAAKIVKYIERNMNASDKKTTGVAVEFFIYDFSLDTNGNIISNNILLLDSLTGLAQSKKLAEEIKSNHILPKSRFNKLFVPVVIIHSGNENENTLKESSVMETVNFFNSLAKKNQGKVFVSKNAIIMKLSHN